MSLDQAESSRGNRIPTPEDDGDLGFDVVGFLARQKWLIVFGLVCGFLLGYLYFVKQPAKFESSGRVLVIKQNSQMPISGRQVGLDAAAFRQRDHLANDMFLIRSRDIVEPAVEENGLKNLETLHAVATRSMP